MSDPAWMGWQYLWVVNPTKTSAASPVSGLFAGLIRAAPDFRSGSFCQTFEELEAVTLMLSSRRCDFAFRLDVSPWTANAD